MILTNMFKKTPRKTYITLNTRTERPEVPSGLLRKCNHCNAAILTHEAIDDHYICPKCGMYFRMNARARIAMLIEDGSFSEWDTSLETKNPLDYKGYLQKLEALKEKTGLDEAVVTGSAVIGKEKVVLCVMDERFLMASMGGVVGEKLTRAIERATKRALPIIIVACSGGARMQEGIISLMQMAKTSQALKRHSDAGNLFISVLTDPTTGGVTASFAMLGDIILAEPGALIGFAGPRVIQQTIGQALPEGFQRAEFLLEHGFIDAIVERKNLRDTLSKLLILHSKKKEVENKQTNVLKNWKQGLEASTDSYTAWDIVKRSRQNDRPVAHDYIHELFDDFIELHGDRNYKDDLAIIGGIASFHGRPITVIGEAKGRNTTDNVKRNFGMPSPEGYRKALRLMKQAEKFNRPILCLVDTPGAFCGLEAEERGQGEAIARNLFELSGIQTPILSIVISEGGSGGALALAVADEVWMLQNAVYSILSPEGYASILWKDSKRAMEAAKVMKLTANDLKDLGVIEAIVPEPNVFTVETIGEVLSEIDEHLLAFLEIYSAKEKETLVDERYKRFRNM
ncbi:MAG: acetyl-CoA carboxylase carboxyltransferase subunit alpha [Velocimicrobium sp.]